MSNSLGTIFQITSFGESHGSAVGIVVDGCPAGLALSPEDIQPDLDRRRPRIFPGSTPRHEKDTAILLSGVVDGHSTGAPVCMMVKNESADSIPYNEIDNRARPGHADYTAAIKYGGMADRRGGGRFSGRITTGFVMAGALARKILAYHQINVMAHIVSIGNIKTPEMTLNEILHKAPLSPIHCVDPATESLFREALVEAARQQDSLGGIVEVIAQGVPAGWGEPVFDTLEGEMAKAMFAIPAVKGVEFGAGFRSASLTGSQNNDPFILTDGKITTSTNNAGGILGGISNGMPVTARVAFKPTPSIGRKQDTVDLRRMEPTAIEIRGRHDTCVVPRAVVVVEAMAAIVLCDLGLRSGNIKRVMA